VKTLLQSIEVRIVFMKNLKLAAREAEQRTIVNVSRIEFGRGFVVIAGPCSVESEEQTLETARAVKAAGADLFRGKAFKPRTSPYAFQGLGLQGLKILAKAREETGLPIVTEVLDPRDVSWVAAGADGLMIEVHYKPAEALCDADQALTPPMFANIMRQLRPLKSFMEQLADNGSAADGGESAAHRRAERIGSPAPEKHSACRPIRR